MQAVTLRLSIPEAWAVVTALDAALMSPEPVFETGAEIRRAQRLSERYSDEIVASYADTDARR